MILGCGYRWARVHNHIYVLGIWLWDILILFFSNSWVIFFYLQENQPTIKPPKDKLLAELILKHKELIWKIHDHDSLLENQVDEHLTEEERKAAWKEYEDEKKGIINMTSNVSLNMGVVMNNVDPLMIKVCDCY